MEPMKDPELLNAADCQGVCIFAEQRRGQLGSVTFELVTAGRALAGALGQPLHAVVLGSGIGELATELTHYGVDQVHAVDDTKLADFEPGCYSAALCAVVREVKPAILLAGVTNLGRSFVSQVAVRLGAGLTANCTALSIDEETQGLKATRPAFGGNVLADVVYPERRPQIATVMHRSFDAAQRSDAASGEVIDHTLPGCAEARTKFLESVDELAGAVDLTEAEIIVSGGRGIGGPDYFETLQQLADTMGGVIGASRAAVDAGWISYSHQVGQTGKTVKPRVYVACGISGAIQHLVGMRSSDTIIAINRDPEAPIFKVATYGLVGDVKQIVPALIERFAKA